MEVMPVEIVCYIAKFLDGYSFLNMVCTNKRISDILTREKKYGEICKCKMIRRYLSAIKRDAVLFWLKIQEVQKYVMRENLEGIVINVMIYMEHNMIRIAKQAYKDIYVPMTRDEKYVYLCKIEVKDNRMCIGDRSNWRSYYDNKLSVEEYEELRSKGVIFRKLKEFYKRIYNYNIISIYVILNAQD